MKAKQDGPGRGGCHESFMGTFGHASHIARIIVRPLEVPMNREFVGRGGGGRPCGRLISLHHVFCNSSIVVTE